MLRGIGSTELLILASILLLLFGGKKIPEFSKGIADGIREFRKATKKETV